MDTRSRLPGYYPETPAVSRYPPTTSPKVSASGGGGTSAGGPIRHTPATAASRARALSTPYSRPPQSTPGSGNRNLHESGVWKKGIGAKTAELVGSLVSGVKDWFSSSNTPKREIVQSIVPPKNVSQWTSITRMEEGLDNDRPNEEHPKEEHENMFSPSLAPHYAGHTPWIVKQKGSQGVSSQEPPLFALPDINPRLRRQESFKYATLPAKRSNALLSVPANKRLRQSSSSRRHLKDWQLSKDRFAEQDQDTLKWCEHYGIDISALANGTQKRPPLPSFAAIQRYEALRNDAAFFERQGIHYIPRHSRKSLRHAASSYELSRLAPKNGAFHSNIDANESSSSKLYTSRQLVSLKDLKSKSEREFAQPEGSKQRNGHSPMNGVNRTAHRESSRIKGHAGKVGDDVWILPALSRPGSSGGSISRSMRMRNAVSPGVGDSWRSTGSARKSRPRGRDIFETSAIDQPMVDESVQAGPALLLPSAAEAKGLTEGEARRKRPGYFSAREEDLEPLEMDIDDVVMPMKKKQRIATHQSPKFAALWEPSRRENWPLGPDEEEKKDGLEVVRREALEKEWVKNELKDLDTPAFKLPPSARKQKDLGSMDVEPPTSSKAVEAGPVFNERMKPPASSAEEADMTSKVSPTSPKPANGGFKFELSQPAFTPISVVTHSQSPPVAEAEKPKDERSPSKASAFVKSVLAEFAEEPNGDKMEDFPTNRRPSDVNANEVSTEPQSTAPTSKFSLLLSQSSSTQLSQELSRTVEKETVTGRFNFGVETEATTTTFEFNTGPSDSSFPPKEVADAKDTSIEAPGPETSKFNFNLPKPSSVEPKVADKREEKTPALSVNFDIPKPTEPKKDLVFGSGGLGEFGSAFNKTNNTAPSFGASSPATPALTGNGTANGSQTTEPVAPDAATAPSAPSLKFNFGPPASTGPTEQLKKPATPPPAAQSQELDDSMDITDSPPVSRSVPGFQGPSVFQFSTAPTSAPGTTGAEPPKPTFAFGSSTVNGTEKVTLPPISFSAAGGENKETGFSSADTSRTQFGSTPSTAFPFGSALPRKEETEPAKPGTTPFSFHLDPNQRATAFGAASTPTKPVDSKPVFGSQSTAPAFGRATTSLFSNQPSVTSPPTAASVSSTPAAQGFNFSFNPPTSTTTSQPFGRSSTFNFSAPPINNPFSSNPAPAASSSGTFPGISSAPVSPQNPQLSSFPPFGTSQQSTNLFGSSSTPAGTTNFQFSQNMPQSPIFTLGASEMQRSSSDAGPANPSPGGRRIAQPSRRRFNRR